MFHEKATAVLTKQILSMKVKKKKKPQIFPVAFVLWRL